MDPLDALVDRILKLPVGSSVTDIEDCIRAEGYRRVEADPDGQIQYVRKALKELLLHCSVKFAV